MAHGKLSQIAPTEHRRFAFAPNQNTASIHGKTNLDVENVDSLDSRCPHSYDFGVMALNP